jgi:hypothetical protein
MMFSCTQPGKLKLVTFMPSRSSSNLSVSPMIDFIFSMMALSLDSEMLLSCSLKVKNLLTFFVFLVFSRVLVLFHLSHALFLA